MTNTNAKRGDGITIVNNTGTDLRLFDNAILDAVLSGGVLPEELADLITLTPVAGYPGRWRVDAA